MLQNLRSSIGMVFQFGALFDSMSVYDNISFAINSLTNFPKDKVKKNIENSLSLVNLEGIEDLKPSELSGGMKKRIGIARAIALKPSFLFYDEPTTGLDTIMTDGINRLINKQYDLINYPKGGKYYKPIDNVRLQKVINNYSN